MLFMKIQKVPKNICNLQEFLTFCKFMHMESNVNELQYCKCTVFAYKFTHVETLKGEKNIKNLSVNKDR